MSIVIGIDLGTNRSRVAVVEDGTPRIVSSRAGGPSTPTAVAFTNTGLKVGAAAVSQAPHNPERTIISFLRLLGRKLQSAEVDWLRSCLPYPVVSADNGDAYVHVDGREYSPQELTSYVLESLVKDVEERLGKDVDEAVIAVPSCYDDLQRRAVLEACRLAGLNVTGLLNSTTATAIAFAATSPNAGRVIIADLGAGTFDVAAVKIHGGAIETLSLAGDQLLGGDDMDRRLVLHFIDCFAEELRLDLTDQPTALLRLTEQAQQTMRELTEATKTRAIRLPDITTFEGVPQHFEHAGISRRELVTVIAEELASVKEPCGWALEDARLGTDDIDEVVVVGGTTRMPAIQSAFKYLFRRVPLRPSNADYMVALGAARYASARAGEHQALEVRDLTATPTGIRVRGNKLLPVIRRNTRLPFHDAMMFQTAGGVQDRAVFELFQGENELATDNTYLGRFSVDNLTGGEFPVHFRVDENGIVAVAGVDSQGEEVALELQLSGGLLEEIEVLRARRAQRAAHSTIPTDSPLPNFKVPTLRLERSNVDEAPSTRFRRPRRHPSGARPGTMPDELPTREPQTRTAFEISADSLVGTTLGGRYLIESIIAEGGMGRVYRAEHQLLKKQFAIKVLHPELASNRELAERFVLEAQAASSIRSDHVVDISDFGLLDDGTSYFVMEYLAGETLERRLDDAGALSAGQVRSFGIQVADGLRGAHEQNIVHRDLKPANILIIERDGQEPHCKILDFGIAKNPTSDSSRNITMVGVIVGTPHYMAPEQIDGDVDGRSDIYALGIVMYEMVTGVPPFDAEAVAEVLARHKWATPRPVHETYAEADCPAELEAIIMRCLAKDPDKRFPTAKELAAALAQM